MAGPRGRAAESRAKAAMYGGDERPLTPEHHGKRMVPGAGASSGPLGAAPFATFPNGTLDEERCPHDFHATHKAPKPSAAKVGSEAFGSDVYRAQAEQRHAIDAQSRTRNCGGPAPYASECDTGRGPWPSNYALGPRERSAGGLNGAAAGVGGAAAVREPTGKVGAAGGFDAGVYASRQAEAVLVAESIHARKHGGGTPFATCEGFDELRRRECHVPKAKRNASAAPKPYSTAGFDPEPYRQQLVLNQANAAASTQRNFVGSGDILSSAPSRPQ